MKNVVLYRPVGPEELALICASGFTAFPPRLPEQAAFLARYPVQQAGGRTHTEHWVPAEDLADFNRHIVGLIEVIAEYRA